ncbi:serine hydrolase FSH [Tricladium varicosporioides]|nr:serine hydrolase FSH [Hymenoscyphus varicosporioides]
MAFAEQPSFIHDGIIGPESSLPIILCLHGGGTNSTIFNVQTVRLQRVLSTSFRFIFLDGPFITTAGPGVMPIFDGCDPFFRWMKTNDDKYRIAPETRRLIESAIVGVEGNVVGVLGFSQGSRLAAGLLWEQQFSDVKLAGGYKFKFGALFNGIAPPMTENLSEDEKKMITIPTMHVVGIEDQWAEDTRELYESYFDKETAVKFEFDYGHHLPVAEDQTAKVAAEILRMYKGTK